jgi:hypothetical protein
VGALGGGGVLTNRHPAAAAAAHLTSGVGEQLAD